MFRTDLLKFIKDYKTKDIVAILCIDANEDMKDRKLAQSLIQECYKELYNNKFPNVETPVLWFRGSGKIDGIWIPSYLKQFNIAIAPHFLGAGDHCAILIDIPPEHLLGQTLFSVCRPNMRRLTTANY